MIGSESAPLISIPLCTYNGEKYLAAQLDSLLAQTYENIEILVFDDASTDSTVSVLSAYAKHDKRISIVVHSENHGFRENFMRAILACHGEFIAPSDQDDVWELNKLAVLVGCIGSHSLAYCDSVMIDAAGTRLGSNVSDFVAMIDADDPVQFAFANCVSGHAMLFRRNLMPSISPVPSGFFHDWWAAAVAASRMGVVYCDQALVRYRQHGGNVTDMRKKCVDRTSRLMGYRLRELREVGSRINALSRLPGGRQALLCRLAQLWSLRESQWFSWRLCGLLLRHGAALRKTQRRSRYRMYKDALRMLPGVKLKRLFNAYAYDLEL